MSLLNKQNDFLCMKIFLVSWNVIEGISPTHIIYNNILIALFSLYDFLMGNKRKVRNISHTIKEHFVVITSISKWNKRKCKYSIHNTESHIHINHHDCHCLIGHDINIGFISFSIRKNNYSALWQYHIPSGDPKGEELIKWILQWSLRLPSVYLTTKTSKISTIKSLSVSIMYQFHTFAKMYEE